MNWRLNKIQYPIYNLGKGKRIGIWVQGCTLACKGCVNQMLWSSKRGQYIPVRDVFNAVAGVQEAYDGVTLSGGEPFQQYPQLITFLHLIKTRTLLDVTCYTGYTLQELYTLFPDKLFLKYIDVLIDGRYVSDQHDNTNTKGSTNQMIYHIEEEQITEMNDLPHNSKWSLAVNNDQRIYMAGIPKQNELAQLCDDLKKVGIHKKFK